MAITDAGTVTLREAVTTLRDRGVVTVLHVDDEPAFADMVSVYLEREGDAIEVRTAHSAAEGLECLADAPVDCIVSDYEMPGTDGLEFLEAVREAYPDLPFILFTGKGNEEIASEAISAGVTDYLQKNGSIEKYTVLANRIENAVRRYRAEIEVEHAFRAIETAREGISFLDEEGTFLYVNDAYADIYGYDREALLGEHWEMLYPDDHVEQVYEEILPAIPQEGRWAGESIHITADGSRLLVDHVLAGTDEGTIICLVEDSTGRKETEQALAYERKRFRRFVDAVEEYAIFALDPEGFVTSWNSGAKRLNGYDRAAILGEHVSTFYPDESATAGVPEDLLAEALAEGSAEDTGWRVRADGSEFWADVTITAVFDEDGTHRGFLQVIRDASEQKAAIEQERAFLEEALDVLEDVFYVLDGDGEIVRVAQQAVDVTGYSREELLGMEPLELFAPEDRASVRADIEDALATGSATIEARIVTADGRTIPYEFRKRRLIDDSGEVYVAGVGRDVSERERRERQLQRQLDQFEHFGSVVSHDLRTPLQTARGRLELAVTTGEQEHLDDAVTALDRMDELIEHLSTVMREGELITEIEAVDLGSCFHAVCGALETAGATIEIEDEVTVGADADALKRLFENLCKNALEHAGSEVTIRVGVLPDGFFVADDGPGVPADERERIFEAGYSTKDAGSGFGLASVRQLAVAHGWDISVTDSDMGGARFEITDVDMLN